MSVKIILNETEKRLVEFVAKSRVRNNSKFFLGEKNISGQDDLELHTNGYGGELAVCKYLGVYPDMTIVYTDQQHDLRFMGEKADVKTTKKPDYGLVVPLFKALTPTRYYIFVIGILPEYEIIGYTDKDTLFKKENIRDFGYGDSYYLDREELIPINLQIANCH